MKKALVTENGIVTDIVNQGEEFEVAGLGETFMWVDCPDDLSDTAVMVNGEFVDEPQRGAPFHMRRRVEYGSIEDQLDMMYKDMLNGTTLWQDHVTAVKALVPKPAEGEPDDPSPLAVQDPTKKPWEK
jgi:hypothetical protein